MNKPCDPERGVVTAIDVRQAVPCGDGLGIGIPVVVIAVVIARLVTV